MSSTVDNLLTRAVLQRYSQDQGKAFVQVTGKLGEIRSDVEHISQYGFRSRPLTGARGVMLAYKGVKQNATVICIDDKRYGKDVTLEEGDVLVFNEKTARILLQEDKILATADEEISGTVNNSFAKVLDGTVEANVNGTQAKVTDGEIKLTVSSTYIKVTDGAIQFSIDGTTYDLTSSSMSTTGDIISNSIVLDSHTHGGVQTGSGSTGGPQ